MIGFLILLIIFFCIGVCTGWLLFAPQKSVEICPECGEGVEYDMELIKKCTSCEWKHIEE
jgi:hypothetical protein